ncbi:SGNH/GDSL hydrolase family protein [Virgibacillus sp. W0181]|uniref:SGNH/GDSL hydrolase family protein n=1 Tax=Virgibacillus sp. W0181 TaxID=3391581 RepID=UPI003F45BEFB
MIHIKQVALYIFILLIIVGIGIILFITNDKKPNTSEETIPQKEEMPKDTTLEEGEPEQKKTAPDSSTDEANNDSEEDEVRDQVKEFIIDSVKSAIDFFFNKGTKVVAIGDSLTQGVGDSTGEGGYVGILNRSLNENKNIVQFENYGKRGNRSDQLLKRLEDPEIAASLKQADIVLITIGANDIMQVFKESFTNLTMRKFEHERLQYEERLEMIFNKIKEVNPDTSIYLLGFYNPFDKYFKDIEELDMIVNGWNNTGKNVAQTFDQTYYIPIDDLFNEDTVNLFAEDNFHPNHLGYQRIAERVLSYLTEQEGEMDEDEKETEN